MRGKRKVGKNMVVPIVMATDYNYLFPTSVTIMSILKNGRVSNIYKFYLLVKKDLVGMDDGVFEQIKAQYPNFEYQYLTVDAGVFESASLTNYHVTVETYYRLLISELLPEYDKCLYLDGDLIVQCDVAELLAFDMQDNYLAAVKDIGMQCGQGSYYTEHQKEIGFDSMDSYFNAGVLVFNLVQIRLDNMVEKFIKAIEKRYTIEDQDILNVTCKDRILYLPVKYNVFSGFLGKEEFYQCGAFEKEEMEQVWKNHIAIIHYAGGNDKPWKNLRCKRAYIWWEYAQTVPTAPWVEEAKENLLKENEDWDWSSLVQKCKQYKEIILYGYTYISRNLLVYLKEEGIDNVRCFCDGNVQKVGQQFQGVACQLFEHVKERITEETLVVICTQKAHKEVNEKLINNGISQKNIARYFLKNNAYYSALDEKYYDFELRQIYKTITSGNTQLKEEMKKKGYSRFAEEIVNCENRKQYEEQYRRYFLTSWCVKQPLVSIVIPSYNVENYIDRCLDAVRRQTYMNWECIVINDGSKDDTWSKLEAWAKKDRRFRVYSQENIGMGPTRNKAIGLAEGKYVTFIDSDDWVEADYIQQMAEAILRENADICKSNFFFHDMAQDTVWEADVTDVIDPEDVKTYIHPNMWCNMFDIRLFRENNISMPGIPLEDMAIYPLLLLKANKVVGAAKPVYHYQINTGSSVMDNIKSMQYYPNAVEYLVKEGKRLGLNEKYEKLFMDIVCYHMYGALNSRIKNNCTPEVYREYKTSWLKFLGDTFSQFKSYYDWHRYWIWGSYNLSRIVANIPTFEKYQLAGKDLPFYFGFSSIIPLMENASADFESPLYTENIVRRDMLTKETGKVFSRIEPEEDDILVLDFLEEQYDLLEIQKDTWMTYSEIWKESLQQIEQERLVNRHSAECRKKWEEACLQFIQLIQSKFKVENVVLVENYMSPKMKLKNGWTLSWNEINTINEMLKEYYDFFKANFPEIKVMQVSEELNYTDGASQYGKAPNYLNALAHREMAARLKELI